MTTTQRIRSAAAIIPAIRTVEGSGVDVRRPFPRQQFSMVDPFLLLDEMGPAEYGPGEAIGFPDHPHRGFETVTYMLEGAIQHKDSVGNSGTITPGAVQWMTAGAGVVHSEMPTDDMVRDGGRRHGFQLWVNLPAAEKMVPSRYQEFPASQIPIATNEEGVWVRVIAGTALGVVAIIETHTPVMYLHFVLQPGAMHVQPVPADFNAFAYILGGEGTIGAEGSQAKDGDLVILERDGDAASLANTGTEPLSVLLIAGVPLREQVARYGPFVMNTAEEIQQAFADYHAGRIGQIAG